MNDLTVGLIDGWDARPFSEGLAEVRSLCASSFTGIVRVDEAASESGTNPGEPTGGDTTNDDPAAPETDNGTERGDARRQTGARRPWLAIIDGEVRGVFDGGIDDFSEATGTIYTAPAGTLVLLCGMVERAGERRGDLYTEANLSAVEPDLPEDFSGYTELIGNGLDGAYYVVYDEGRSSSVVVREHAGEPVASTGPEDFDRASEDSSVYEVRAAALDSVPVPEAEEPDPDPDPARDPTAPSASGGPTDSTDSPAESPTDTGATAALWPDTAAADSDTRPPAGSADQSSTDRSSADRTGDDAERGVVAELRAERDRLRADVTRLETALDAYRSGTSRGMSADADGGIDTDARSVGGPGERQGDAALETETERDPERVLAGTTLLVRYDTQGAPTLARAGEDTDPEAVRANLRITPHTDFDAGGTMVSDTDFDDFLRSSIEYRFVEWVLGELFFEIRDTGNTAALRALSAAIPSIDRADLKGTVDVEYVAEGDTERGVEAFDVVFRDRMSEPLLVARLDETRVPAPVERVTDLLTAANRVGETVDDLAGAMSVSGGYFEPEALRTAEEVTDGGFLSRDSRKSFVKRSRRRGYHLCLVEAMDGGFHFSVPEL